MEAIRCVSMMQNANAIDQTPDRSALDSLVASVFADGRGIQHPGTFRRGG